DGIAAGTMVWWPTHPAARSRASPTACDFWPSRSTITPGSRRSVPCCCCRCSASVASSACHFLYWHDSAPVQAGVGTAMGLVYWHIGVVAYTLAAAKPGVIPETADDRAEVRRFVHVALLPLLIAALVAAISRCVWQ